MNAIAKWATLPVLTGALCLSACGKKEPQAAQNPAPAPDTATAVAATPAAPKDETGFTVTPVFDNGGSVNFNSVDSLLQQGQFDQAVLSVVTAQRSGRGTTDDSLKLQRKMQDIQADVIRKAAAGDARAIEAMKLLRKTAPSGGGR